MLGLVLIASRTNMRVGPVPSPSMIPQMDSKAPGTLTMAPHLVMAGAVIGAVFLTTTISLGAHLLSSEDLLSLGAPSTTKCDFCQVAFCGLGIPDRCVTLPLEDQRPHRFGSVTDLLLTTDVYDAFDSNTVETEFLIAHLESHRLSPRDVYREVILPSCFTLLLSSIITKLNTYLDREAYYG
jgi:hypothetical protein